MQSTGTIKIKRHSPSALQNLAMRCPGGSLESGISMKLGADLRVTWGFLYKDPQAVREEGVIHSVGPGQAAGGWVSGEGFQLHSESALS